MNHQAAPATVEPHHRPLRNARSRLALALPAAIAAVLCIPAPRSGSSRAADVTDTSGELPEVIVSARKRDEKLVDVPASVDVISAETLDQQRVNTVDNLFGKVPSLYFSANFLSPGRDYVNLVIRGIGAQSAGVPAVGTYVDGVYQPSLGFDIGFLDLERVEVLEGPQGTLFGRNTEGGALNIVTRKPTQDFRGMFETSYDSFNTADEKLSISGGIAPDFAAGFAFRYMHTDGYLKARGIQEELAAESPNGSAPTISADDMRKVNGRAALRWTPADSGTDVNLTFDMSDNYGNSGLPGVPISGLPMGRGDDFGGDRYGVYSDFQVPEHDRNDGIALTVDQDLSFGKFSSITGYRYLSSQLPFDFDGGIDYRGNYHDLRQRQDFASQELRLSGEVANQLSWVGGLFGFDEDDNQYRAYNLQTIPELTGIIIYDQNQLIKRVGYAAFGQVSWTPVQPLEITGGLRYSWEKARSNFFVYYTIPNYFGPGQTLLDKGTDNEHTSFSNLSPTGSVRYKFTDGLSVYARYAKGFKPGGYPSAPDVGTNIAYKAETSDNYELGFKSDLFEHRLSANIDVYDIEIKNQQLSTIVYNSLDLPLASVGNAGKSRSRGVELTVDAHPITGLTLGLNAGFVDAKYVQYVDTSGRDRAGEQFPFTPRRTASLSADYEHAIFNGWTGSVGSSYRYVDHILSGTGVDLDLQFPVPSYSQLDLRAGIAKDHWRFDGYIDNVTDRYIITRIWNTFFYPDPPARPFATVAPPRRYGLRATYTF